jgi:hypothetical protein
MGLKPIPLSAYSKDLIPPVTGIGGNLQPVANSYDSSGNFAGRSRAGSASKKRKINEIDRVFDLSEPYPPLNPPSRPQLDLTEIRSLLVAATVAGEEAGKLFEEPELDPRIKTFGNLTLALLGVVSAIVENGLIPLNSGPMGSSSGHGGAGGGGVTSIVPGIGTGAGTGTGTGLGGKNLPPLPPPKQASGIRELVESLEKADTESVLFDANLGNVSIGNRNNLAAAFSNGLRAAAISMAEAKGGDPAEAVRAMNDALDCVADMEFIGIKSELQKDRAGMDANKAKHFTMPVKLKFDDRNSRLHFEKSIKMHCGLRAVMSLPRTLREEQALFSKAMRERYPGAIISVRPDMHSLHFVAFRKETTSNRWTKCNESVPIPQGVMLPHYKSRSSITLPPIITETAVQDDGAVAGAGSGSGSVPGAGAGAGDSSQMDQSQS